MRATETTVWSSASMRASVTAAELASHTVNRMRDKGILLSTDGPFHNVLKIKPPLVFTDSDADRLVATLNVVIKNEW